MPSLDIEAAATENWTIAPATKRFIRPAKFLPHHLDRIKGTEFGSVSEILKGFRGNYETTQEATVGGVDPKQSKPFRMTVEKEGVVAFKYAPVDK